jgi:ATP-dependent Clp protease ATP-binding subunit ClpC
MLPKSSKRVARVIQLANDFAREYEQEYVGTEHVLLAILEEGTGIGARVLAERGITAEKLRMQVDKLVRKSMEETWVFGRLPGTPHFKNVVATAIEQCQQLEDREVSTEHLLLALSKEKGSVAQRTLAALGLEFDDLRKGILALSAK